MASYIAFATAERTLQSRHACRSVPCGRPVGVGYGPRRQFERSTLLLKWSTWTCW